MQKAEPQHGQAHNQPAVKQGGGAALASPEGAQIAQLETIANDSPQAQKLSGLAAMMSAGPGMAAQRKLADTIHSSPRQAAQRRQFDSLFGIAQRAQEEPPAQLEQQPAQLAPAEKRPNHTGLPDSLKNGVESLSGMSMDNVRVHYNSSQPAQLNAHAYAQGTDIHLAPGQEKHLPHEAWHVVQQAQGRVKPTMQMKEGVPVNDDTGLEHEADVMGGQAASIGAKPLQARRTEPGMEPGADVSFQGGAFTSGSAALQRMTDSEAKAEDKKKYEALKKCYSSRLSFLSGDLYKFTESVPSFPELLEAADDLTDLKKAIDKHIEEGEKNKKRQEEAAQAASAAAAALPAATPSTAAAPSSSSSTSSTSSSSATASGAAALGSAQDEKESFSKQDEKQPGKKKAKQKFKPLALSSTGFHSAPVVQQPVPVVKPTTNPLIQQWMAAKPVGASITRTGIVVSEDTVYIYVTLTLPQQGFFIPTHEMEIHYHPVPTSANYLHIKAKAGGSAQNILLTGSWLIPPGSLQSADAEWDKAYPGNKSQKPHQQ